MQKSLSSLINESNILLTRYGYYIKKSELTYTKESEKNLIIWRGKSHIKITTVSSKTIVITLFLNYKTDIAEKIAIPIAMHPTIVLIIPIVFETVSPII